MRLIICIFALTALLQAQGFRRPDQIKKDAETELHKYFPRAVVMVSAEREAIIGFTCAANLGDSTINELTALVDRNSAVQRLKEALQATTEIYTFSTADPGKLPPVRPGRATSGSVFSKSTRNGLMV